MSGWEAAADSRGKLWTPVKKLVEPAVIERIRDVPSRIAADGSAVTWVEIEKQLPQEARPVHSDLRNSLQHIYFKQYCKEFDLVVMCELPFRSNEFGLPTERPVYNFTRFAEFLDVFQLRRLLLRCSAGTACEIKRKPGIGQQNPCDRPSNLQFHLNCSINRTPGCFIEHAGESGTFQPSSICSERKRGSPRGLGIVEIKSSRFRARKRSRASGRA